MAANYWDSTQRRHWMFSKEQLASMRQQLEEEDHALVQMLPLPQQRHLSIYFNHQLTRLGKRLYSRQQAIATAQVYIKRFYSKVEIRRTNPILVIVTALYLALKMEECPQHIRIVAQEAGNIWNEYNFLEPARLGETEFYLISEMQSQMIVHQPYRTLTSLQQEFSLSSEEVSLSWTVINDHFMTDLPLLQPPHIIALAAILLAVVLRSPSHIQQPNNHNAVTGSATGSSNASSASAGLAAASAALAQAQARVLAGGNGSQQQASASSPASKDKIQDPRSSKVQRIVTWLADSDIDIEAIVDCTQEFITFWEVSESYNDKLTKDQIHRIIKVRGLDK